LRREGIRVRSGWSKSFVTRVEELTLPAHLIEEVGPLLACMAHVNARIESLDRQVTELARKDEVARRLVTAPGVGSVIALSFVATLDGVERFRGPHQVEAYLGLVPREWSSSEVQRRGHITKAGNTRMRWLLVEAARCVGIWGRRGRPRRECGPGVPPRVGRRGRAPADGASGRPGVSRKVPSA
jgi:transposase